MNHKMQVDLIVNFTSHSLNLTPNENLQWENDK